MSSPRPLRVALRGELRGNRRAAAPAASRGEAAR